MTRRGVLPLLCVLASGVLLAQTPGVQSSTPTKGGNVNAITQGTGVTLGTPQLSDTEKIALQSVLKEREALGQKLSAIDTDVRKSHPGYHLEWGMENVTLVKDVEEAKPASAPKK